jgi:hypothetical protein
VGLASFGRATVALQQRDSATRLVPLNGPSSASLLISDVGPPFTVAEISADGRARWSDTPRGSWMRPLADVPVISIGALPLGCGRTLQVLANLHSDDRWFVLYDGPRFARVTKINRPLGFSAAVAGRFLLGYDDTPGASGIVLYRWRWEPHK